MDLKKTGTFKKEYNKLTRLLKDLDPNTLELVNGMIEIAAYDYVLMEKCITNLEKDGAVYMFINGKQQFMKQNSNFEVYTKAQSQYLAIMKELLRVTKKVDDISGKPSTTPGINSLMNTRAQKLRMVK